MAIDDDSGRDAGPVTKREIVAKNDAYTGMLTISLFALIAGGVLLFLDYQRYDYGKAPPKVQMSHEPFNPGSETVVEEPVQKKKAGNPPPPIAPKNGNQPKGAQPKGNP
jgi:hypothetical protein